MFPMRKLKYKGLNFMLRSIKPNMLKKALSIPNKIKSRHIDISAHTFVLDSSTAHK